MMVQEQKRRARARRQYKTLAVSSDVLRAWAQGRGWETLHPAGYLRRLFNKDPRCLFGSDAL